MALALGSASVSQKPASAASDGPDISIAVDPDGGGDNCDTRPATSIGATCVASVGSQVIVKGNVDSAAGLPDIDGDTQHGYAGFQFRLLRSAGLTLNNPPGTDTELGFPGPFWPDCGSGRGDSESGQQYDIVCFSAGGESLFLGKVVEVAYTCTTPGLQTITMDDAASYIHNDGHGNLPLDKEGNEALAINCVPGVGGVAVVPAAAAATSSELPRRDGLPHGVAAAAAVGAGALAGTVWIVERRRRLGGARRCQRRRSRRRHWHLDGNWFHSAGSSAGAHRRQHRAIVRQTAALGQGQSGVGRRRS
jgi:hypothetical protein